MKIPHSLQEMLENIWR